MSNEFKSERREAKERKRRRMGMSGRSLKTVILPIIAKRAGK